MIRALFFDIDGTLVSFKTHEIPASTVEALRKAKERGIQVFISTGRPNILINNLSAIEALVDGYITMNGSYCFVGEEVIYKSAIPEEDVHQLTNYCYKRDIPCIIVGEHDICAIKRNELIDRIFHQDLHVTTPILDTPLEKALPVGKQVFQLTPFITVEQEAEIAGDIPNCEIGRWHPAFTDTTAKGNTKQRGIDAIIQHFGIPLEETMAFGDGGNDISMLRHAGIGVAMGNAGETVRQAADYVTASVDEEGVAKALKHFGVIEE